MGSNGSLLEKLTHAFYEKLYEPSLVKRAMMVLEKMKVYERQVIKIDVSDGTPGLTESKFGGLPYIPENGDVPKGEDGLPLCLLAQFNLSELPADVFPLKSGILQFWAADNDLIGADFDDPLTGKNSCVRYHESIDAHMNEEQLKLVYPGPGKREGGWFPLESSFSLSFTTAIDPINPNEDMFGEEFKRIWTENWPKSPANGWYDMPDDFTDSIMEANSGFGHKLLGHPGFTQSDPRYNPGTEKMVLLFQMDSQGTDKHEIMWGDCGVCNWFIAKDDLIQTLLGR